MATKKPVIDDYGDFPVEKAVPAPKARVKPPTAPVMKVFIPRNDMNPSEIKYVGWINGKYYEYPRGAVSEVPMHIAAEILMVGAGQAVG